MAVIKTTGGEGPSSLGGGSHANVKTGKQPPAHVTLNEMRTGELVERVIIPAPDWRKRKGAADGKGPTEKEMEQAHALAKKWHGEIRADIEKRGIDEDCQMILAAMGIHYDKNNPALTLKPEDEQMVIFAYELAKKLHAGQLRKNKTSPYINHIIKAMRSMAWFGGGPIDVAAEAVHDTVEEARKERKRLFLGKKTDLPRFPEPYNLWLAINAFFEKFEGGAEVAYLLRDMTVPKIMGSTLKKDGGSLVFDVGREVVFADQRCYNKPSDLEKKWVREQREFFAAVRAKMHLEYKKNLFQKAFLKKIGDILANLITLGNLTPAEQKEFMEKNLPLMQLALQIDSKLGWLMISLCRKYNDELPDELKLSGDFALEKIAEISRRYMPNLSSIASGPIVFDFRDDRVEGNVSLDRPWHGLKVVCSSVTKDEEYGIYGLDLEFPAPISRQRLRVNCVDMLIFDFMREGRLPKNIFAYIEDTKETLLGREMKDNIERASFSYYVRNSISQTELVRYIGMCLMGDEKFESKVVGSRKFEGNANDAIFVSPSMSILTQNGLGIGKNWNFVRILWTNKEEFDKYAAEVHEVIEKRYVPAHFDYILGKISFEEFMAKIGAPAGSVGAESAEKEGHSEMPNPLIGE